MLSGQETPVILLAAEHFYVSGRKCRFDLHLQVYDSARPLARHNPNVGYTINVFA
jgi:hypothetical protein